MLGNCIAIYMGAPDVGEYFNPRSFINFHDFSDYRAVIRKVIELDRDDTAYNRMLRTPFFANNEVPEIILNKEKALSCFLDKVLDVESHDSVERQ